MVIKKKNTSERKEHNWFMFAMGLKHHVFADYISIKLAHLMEPLTFVPSTFARMVELVEKLLKLYLSFKEQREDALSHYSSIYGHNIEKLRTQAANYDEVFNEVDIRQFASAFDDKRGALFQHLRYGSQPTIDGFSTNINVLMPIVEKVFFSSTLKHQETDKKMINHNSAIYMLLTASQMDQSRNPKLLIRAIQMDNPYFEAYKTYCNELSEFDKKFNQQLERQKKDQGNEG